MPAPLTPRRLILAAATFAITAALCLTGIAEAGPFERLREKVEDHVEDETDRTHGNEGERDHEPSRRSDGEDESREPASVLSVTRTAVGDPDDIDRRSDPNHRWRVNVSEQGMRVGYVAKRGSRSVVVVDGEAGPEFDEILDTYPPQFMPGADNFGRRGQETFVAVLFSPDGQRHGYTARRGDDYHFVVDGEPGPALRAVSPYGQRLRGRGGPSATITQVQFSDDGRRHVCVGSVEGDGPRGVSKALIDTGEIIATHDDISHALLSPDGERLAYAAADSEDRETTTHLVLDGEEFGPFTEIHRSAFLPNGDHFALVGVPGGRGRGGHVLINGRPAGPRIDVGGAGGDFVIDPIGRVGFIARLKEDNSHVVVVDGEVKHTAEFRGPVRYTNLTLSPTGDGYAVVMAEGGSAFVLVNGEKTGFGYDGIEEIAFSADGESVGYVAKKDYISYVVVDDEEQEGVKSVLRFVFAPKGDRWAFIGQGDARTGVLVVDGEQIDLPEKSKPIDFAFSPDGRRLVHLTRRGSNATVFLDGEPIHEHVPHIRVLRTETLIENNRGETIAHHFAVSPDGSRVLYSTFGGFVVNGEMVTEGEVYDPVVSGDAHHFAGWDGGMGVDARLVLDGRKSATSFGRPERLETRRLHIAEDGTVTALVETDNGLERLTARP